MCTWRTPTTSSLWNRIQYSSAALDPTNVVAFGDAENDVDMFRLAGASVAMGQADEATKSAASFVSKPNFEAGVAYAIRRLLDRGAL
jgi:hydroxymethylpyrimidine pyrophosphatase-like HAD family hydrolase